MSPNQKLDLSEHFSRKQNWHEFVIEIQRDKSLNPKNIATVKVLNSNIPCETHCKCERDNKICAPVGRVLMQFYWPLSMHLTIVIVLINRT